MRELAIINKEEISIIDGRVLINNRSNIEFEAICGKDDIKIILGHDAEGPYYKTIELGKNTIINIEVCEKAEDFSKIYIPNELNDKFSADTIYRLNLLNTDGVISSKEGLKTVAVIRSK